MKIEFDKALLWLVPYLYLVSIVYYLGYWGTFGIDAFNYYEVSDLVKGVVAALGMPMLFVLLGCLVLLISTWITDDTIELNSLSEKRKAQLLLLIGGLFILLTFILYLSFNTDEGKLEVSNFFSLFSLMKVLLFSIALTFSFGIAVQFSVEKAYKPFTLTLFTAFALTYLPCSAFIAGKKNALKISQNKEYDYIVADSIDGNQKAIYKYLGKTGDYYVLTGLRNDKRIIISADKLDPLLIERLSLNDTASIRKLEIHKKALEGIIKQLPKQPE